MTLIENALLWPSIFVIGATLLPGFLSIISAGISLGTSYYLLTLIKIYFQLDSTYFVSTLFGVALFLLLNFKTRKIILSNVSKKQWQETFDLFTIGLVLYFATSWAIPAVVGWDARSIWLLHAKWLKMDVLYENLQQQPIATFSHPDYPVAGSSTLELFLKKTNQLMSYESAVRGIAFVSFCIQFYGAYLLSRKFNNQAFIKRLFLISSFSILQILDRGYGTTSGYMDKILAISIFTIAAGLVQSFSSKIDNANMILLAFIAIYATGLKQEGIAMVGIIYFSWAVTNTMHFKNKIRYLKFMLPPVGLWLTWSLYLRTNDIPTTSDATGIFSNAIPSKINMKNAMNYIDAFFSLGGYSEIILATLVMVLIYALCINQQAWERQQGKFIIFAIFLNEILLIAVYSLGSSRENIEWWMGTSFSRISMTAHALMILGLLLVVFNNNLMAKKPKATSNIGRPT